MGILAISQTYINEYFRLSNTSYIILLYVSYIKKFDHLFKCLTEMLMAKLGQSTISLLYSSTIETNFFITLPLNQSLKKIMFELYLILFSCIRMLLINTNGIFE